MALLLVKTRETDECLTHGMPNLAPVKNGLIPEVVQSQWWFNRIKQYIELKLTIDIILRPSTRVGVYH